MTGARAIYLLSGIALLLPVLAAFAIPSQAELVNNDHTSLSPIAYDTVVINVGSTALNTTGALSIQTVANAPGVPGRSEIVNLGVRNNTFIPGTITVTRGDKVTIYFNNQDSGVQQNFALYPYKNSNDDSIFVGNTITGPATTTYYFTAPSNPETYYFRSDPHPTMNGLFIVT